MSLATMAQLPRSRFTEIFPFPQSPPLEDGPALDPIPKIKERIFKYAGREAVAAYRVACGNPAETIQPYVEGPLLYEPFTYADWHEVTEEEWAGKKGYIHREKRRLLWERERAYKANGMWSNAPTPQKRWEEFKRSINNANRKYVKKIALPQQMEYEDLRWIAQSLPELEALDLSALRIDGDNGSGGGFLTDFRAWDMYLNDMKYVTAHTLEPQDMDLFTWYPNLATKKDITSQLVSIENERKRAYGLHRQGVSTGPSSEDARQVLRQANKRYRSICATMIRNQQTHLRAYRGSSMSDELQRLMGSINTPLFGNLKWLGIRISSQLDFQGVADKIGQVVLSQCKHLKTLSIRDDYLPDFYTVKSTLGSPHTYVCEFILRIAKYTLPTVSTIELRMSISFPQYFLLKLQELRPSIKRVGIDLGAWVQVYPLRKSVHESMDHGYKNDFLENDVRISAKTAALESRLEAYKEAHDTIVPKTGTWVLPSLDAEARVISESDTGYSWGYDDAWDVREEEGSDSDSTRQIVNGPGHNTCPLDEVDHETTCSMLKESNVHTLPQMLKRLYDSRPTGQGGLPGNGIQLIPLEPEPWNRSTDPIHPFALIQKTAEAVKYPGQPGTKYRYLNLDDEMGKVYSWLETVFRWRPVFDWDWFMVPELMYETLDSAYKRLFAYGKVDELLLRIRTQFDLLREAGIPVHLLIGRRSEKSSSCYWGWPYNEGKWNAWLKKEFDANLSQIADCVDNLTISYDLRNPLDQRRLKGIDAMNPHTGPAASCPSVLCPWRGETTGLGTHSEECPFETQREPQGHSTRRSQTIQKTVNRQVLNLEKSHTPIEGYERLANSDGSAPPVGENANDHPSDDSDIDDAALPADQANLHHIARKAAFVREAVGWQRFWARYAMNFTRLTTLRVRMPQAFDKIGSWRLGRLLDQNMGWKMIVFTDERQHVQTNEDLARTLPGLDTRVFEHEPEAKVWPAGRFIRRTWFWPERNLKWRAGKGRVIEEPVSDPLLDDTSVSVTIRKWEADVSISPVYADRWFIRSEFTDTLEGEEQQFQKAAQRAFEASKRELELETSKGFAHRRARFVQSERDRLASMRDLASAIWSKQLDYYIEELQKGLDHQLQERNRSAVRVLNRTIARLKKTRRLPVPIFKELEDGQLMLRNYYNQWSRLLRNENYLAMQSGTGYTEHGAVAHGNQAEFRQTQDLASLDERHSAPSSTVTKSPLSNRGSAKKGSETKATGGVARGTIKISNPAPSQSAQETPLSAAKSSNSRPRSSIKDSTTKISGKRSSASNPIIIHLDEDARCVEPEPAPEPKRKPPRSTASPGSKTKTTVQPSASSGKRTRESVLEPDTAGDAVQEESPQKRARLTARATKSPTPGNEPAVKPEAQPRRPALDTIQESESEQPEPAPPTKKAQVARKALLTKKAKEPSSPTAPEASGDELASAYPAKATPRKRKQPSPAIAIPAKKGAEDAEPEFEPSERPTKRVRRGKSPATRSSSNEPDKIPDTPVANPPVDEDEDGEFEEPKPKPKKGRGKAKATVAKGEKEAVKRKAKAATAAAAADKHDDEEGVEEPERPYVKPKSKKGKGKDAAPKENGLKSPVSRRTRSRKSRV
ncbi:hypothetical protein K504DRAFT_497380 [Pleomassaria siparia CBS 279.74]|uniref:Uncharacterized protein n=1 Tax=Pleomassaria siparia CBS 279.74 TaxID=1314801 RepID=A0A6G1KSH8_9PLEO|nr:hypothetical protein K504DRAFT_497380 [Pleomassaria siparia CBS 279.74]